MSIKISSLQTALPVSGSDFIPVVQDNGGTLETRKIAVIDLMTGGGLAGTQYILVTADGTPTENATALQSAYDELKTMSPSINNRLTLIAAPGEYEFPNSSPFTMDTEFINLVSLSGNRDIIIYTTNADNNLTVIESIIVDEDNVFIKGIDASKPIWINDRGASLAEGSFNISDDFEHLICENCKGGKFSFGGEGIASGTFIGCIGGFRSFGGGGTASGEFKDCVGGGESFGGFGTTSGTFTSCIGDGDSFGGGASGVLSGKLYFCRLTGPDNSFQTVSGSGVTVLCIDGNNEINTQN